MLQSSELIWHKGKVLEAQENNVKVVIENVSACSHCHGKKACPVSDTEYKIVEVNDATESFSPGDDVVVYFEESIGFRALFLGYLVPFVILFSALLAFFSLTGNELKSGISAVSILIFYYFGLYIFRSKIAKSFTFKILRKNT